MKFLLLVLLLFTVTYPAKREVKFAIIGDPHLKGSYYDKETETYSTFNEDRDGRLIDAIGYINKYNLNNPDSRIEIVFFIGDIFSTSDDVVIRHFVNYAKRLEVPYIPILGDNIRGNNDGPIIQLMTDIYEHQKLLGLKGLSYPEYDPSKAYQNNMLLDFNGVRFIIADAINPAGGVSLTKATEDFLNGLTDDYPYKESSILLSHVPCWNVPDLGLIEKLGDIVADEIHSNDEQYRLRDWGKRKENMIYAGFCGHGHFDEGFNMDVRPKKLLDHAAFRAAYEKGWIQNKNKYVFSEENGFYAFMTASISDDLYKNISAYTSDPELHIHKVPHENEGLSRMLIVDIKPELSDPYSSYPDDYWIRVEAHNPPKVTIEAPDWIDNEDFDYSTFMLSIVGPETDYGRNGIINHDDFYDNERPLSYELMLSTDPSVNEIVQNFEVELELEVLYYNDVTNPEPSHIVTFDLGTFPSTTAKVGPNCWPTMDEFNAKFEGIQKYPGEAFLQFFEPSSAGFENYKYSGNYDFPDQGPYGSGCQIGRINITPKHSKLNNLIIDNPVRQVKLIPGYSTYYNVFSASTAVSVKNDHKFKD